MNEDKEFLVQMLSRVTGLNLIIVAAFPPSPDILDRVGFREKGTGRRLTLKEAVDIEKQRPQ